MSIGSSYWHVFLLCSVLASSLLLGGSSPAQAATTDCAYNFQVATKYSFLRYCVTQNGNILSIETPSGHPLSGPGGEGYGVCQESPATDYHDYAAEDTGNWNAPRLVSLTSDSVKVARTTSDGNWRLTQTITRETGPPSIRVVMALKNLQSVPATAYLVRYVDVLPRPGFLMPANSLMNVAFVTHLIGDEPDGLLLQNAGTQQFGFRQLLIQLVANGPNSCAWAYDAFAGETRLTKGGLIAAYAGAVPALSTRTATMIYLGM